MGHQHTIDCYARNANGPLAYTPCRPDGHDRNLTNLKEVDFKSGYGRKGLTLICTQPETDPFQVDSQPSPGVFKIVKRASYREGIAWIGHNDLPEEMDPEVIQGFISTLLLADLFDVPPEKVAEDVLKFRNKNKV